MLNPHDASTLVELLRFRAGEDPDRIAYTFLLNGESEEGHVTYGELDLRARAVAARLQALGARGERALLLYPPGLEYIAALFGCFYAGVTAVPAYPPRRNKTDPRLQSIVGDCGPTLALTTRELLGEAERLCAHTPELAGLRWMATEDVPAAEAGGWRDPEADGETIAFLQYTSGSTAAPKGVMVSHGNLLHNFALIEGFCGYTPQTRSVIWLPPYHDMGLIGGILQPLFTGYWAALFSPVAFIQRPARWLEAISRYQATSSGGPNFAYDLCVHAVRPEERAGLDLSHWEIAFNGAEPVRHETLRAFSESFAPCGFRARAFYPCYGLAEATLMVTGSRPEGLPVEVAVEPEALGAGVVREADAEGRYRLVGSGRSAASQRVLVVDPGTLRACAADRVGEVWVAGPSVARGYWGRAAETAETFGAFEAGTGEGPFLRTGDLGFLADGELFITGRLKDLIVIRGRNHYPQDVEQTAMRSHAGLRAGSCAAFSIDLDGEERLVVVQEVSRHAAAGVDVEEVGEAIRRAVAVEHGVQVHAVALVRPGGVPKTSSGKVQRRACKGLFLVGDLPLVGLSVREDAGVAAPRPVRAGITREALEAAEVGERQALLEELLVERAAQVLGVDASRVDREQPLVALGMDSLRAMELKGALETALGTPVPVSSLLDDTRIDRLAADLLQELFLAEAAAPAEASRVEGECPLSFAQERLWFLDRLEPGSTAYNLSGALRLRGAVDAGALRRSLEEIVRRHDTLRTVFADAGGRPVQRVTSAGPVALPAVDLSRLAPGAREEAARRAAEAAARTPFDLETGPLFRARLLRLGGEEHLLVLAMHHIVSDGWSAGVLIREVGALYPAMVAGAPSPLPPLPTQYGDWALRQRDGLRGEVVAEQLAYWRERLAGLAPLDLPTDRPRPAVQSFRGATHRFEVPAEVMEGVRGLARAEGATLFMALLAAWDLLLTRYTGESDVAVGTTVSNRDRAEVSGLIGMFVNTLVLRVEVAPGAGFRTLLRRARAASLEAFTRQDLPFERLVEEVHPERDLSRNPLFQVMLAPQDAALEPVEVPGATLFPEPLDGGAAIVDLTLYTGERVGGALEASLEYATDLFEAATVGRMAAHLVQLMGAVAAAPDLAVAELPLLLPAERTQVLEAWNATGRPYPERCLHDLFAEQAARTPDAAAIRFEGAATTYAELERGANRLAHHLRALGVGPEARVGLCMERTPDMVAAMLGILRAGGAYVPLDPAYPAERLAYMLEDAGAMVVVAQAHLAERLPAGVPRVLPDAEAERIAARPDTAPEEGAGPGNLAYVLYTSGSTGRPKGVQVEHRSASHIVHFLRDVVRPEDRAAVLGSTSISFDVSVGEIFGTICWGGTLVLVENALELPRVAREGVRLVVTVPSAAAELLRSGDVPESVRAFNLAGEALSAMLARDLYARPRTERVLNLYGPTEDTVYSTWSEVERGAERVGIGRPVANSRAYVLDPAGSPAPVGVPGELCLGGAGTARGYHGRPELTATQFVPDPFAPEAGARMYRTGDRARWLAGGELEYLGRIDQQVKVRGFRVEPGEVEAALCAHPAVRDAAVAARPDAGGGMRLVAYHLPADGEAPPAPAELRAWLRERLPEHMVPAAFVALDAFPLTPSGKTDRRALPEPEAEAAAHAEPVAPSTPVEEILAGIWAQVLGTERVGVHDDFFALGGHSLLGAQVVSRIRVAFEVELPLRALFEAPSVAGLAARIEALRSDGSGLVAPPIEPARREARGALPLSFAQQRLWVVDQLDPGSPAYNMPFALRLRGALDAAALRAGIGELVRRHETLRTTFEEQGGAPVQVVHPPAGAALRVVDLRGLPDDAREREAAGFAEAEAVRPFDLARGPLLRSTLLRLDEDDHVLCFTMHHVVGDGWSTDVMVRELSALYDAFSRGESSPLPELPVQYADFAVWQRKWLGGGVLEAQIGYWKKKLGGAPPLLEIATDRPRAVAQDARAGSHRFALSPEVARRLRALSRREGATLFMTTLAAWQALLGRYAGQEDVVVGVPVAGRMRVEVEGLVGFFVNMLALRTDLGGEPTWLELLGRVREEALGAFAHQDLPFERLVEELDVERSLTHTPVFQAVFALNQAAATHRLALGELELEPFAAGPEGAKFDLDLAMEEDGEKLGGTLLFRESLFEAHTVARMAGHLEVLLGAMAADPAARLSEVSLLRGAERVQVLQAWTAPTAEYPRACVHELIAEQAARTPDALAVVFEGGSLTYAELESRSGRLADRLLGRGVGPEARVALLLDRSPELAVALLGVLKAGGAYVPLDPTYPPERLAYLLADSGARVVVTHTSLVDALPAAAPAPIFMDGDDPAPAAPAAAAGVDPDNAAYVIYTSGSTGLPKGVMVSHASLVCYAESARGELGLGAADRFLQFASPSFDVMVEEVFPTWLSGAAVVFPGHGLLDAPHGLLEVVEALGVTCFELPTAFWHECVRMLTEEDRRLPASVRFVIVGGERVLPERLTEWARLDVPLVHVFGLTETTVSSTMLRLEPGDGGARWSNLPVGGPMPNVALYVLDAGMQPVPERVPGELYLGGDTVARGYSGRPALTAERFVPDPFGQAGGRLYRTGDRVRWLSDGGVEFLGRIDQQVKVRGYRIEPAEIEASLANHPAVREAAVIVREDVPGDRRLVAYVSPAAGYAIGAGEMRRVAASGAELWPSHGEYPVYDDLLYGAMAGDRLRNEAYLQALREVAVGKTVVDVGTGGQIVLTRLALEAGARKVYAIEAMEESFRQAQALVRELGLEDRVTLILGDATTLELPEPADVCVSELIGCIGGSEGAVEILNHARRWLKPDGVMIPQRCVTRIAAVTLPDELHQAPAFTEVGAHYAERVFAAVGHRDDVRLCVRGFPEDHLLSGAAVFEDLDFGEWTDPEFRNRFELRVERDGRLDGMLLWIQLHPGEGLVVDALEDDCAWLPMFFPVFYPGVEVRAGDVLRVESSGAPAQGAAYPDYHLRGTLARTDGTAEEFAYDSWWKRPPAEPNALHRRLVTPEGVRVRPAERERVGAEELRAHVGGELPSYMVPSAFVLLESLPLTHNGKVDRRALPAPAAVRQEETGAGAAPRTETEETLAGIWAEVLRVERVGVTDNFFALGGDSILAIQIVSRARRAGLWLRPRQLFLHPTVAQLARQVSVVESAAEEAREAATGEVELTPIQRWFFEEEIPQRHHWNMPLLLELRRPADAGRLEAALERVAAHHDALGFRYAPSADGAWTQTRAAPGGPVPLERVDLAGVPADELAERIERRSEEAQAGLDLEHGPLLRAVLLEPGGGAPQRLLLVAHHLVVDGVSWRILLDDLQTAYEQLGRGEAVVLPHRTTSFRRWARRLAEHTARGGFDAELDFWLDEPRRMLRPLPVDSAAGRAGNTAGASRTLSVTLDREATRALLQDVPAAYRTQVGDVLLCALARAFAGWTGEARLLVDLEGHGREDLFEDVDLSRTVGWFTTVHPVLLDLRGAEDEGASLKRVKEQLREVPGQGIGYGALRYLSPDAATRGRLAALPRAEVSFNHLGQADAGLPEEGLFAMARESAGSGVSPEAPRQHLLEVNSIVLDGQLRVDWSYGAAIHRRATVEALAGRYLAELRRLVAHCVSAEAGGFTPSDFPLARLSQDELDRLPLSVPGVEDVYPLSPLQEGLLFHVLYEPEEGFYLAQYGFEIGGELDVEAMRRAWDATLARHTALRASFLWKGMSRPLQVVHREPRLPVAHEDWRDLPEAGQEAALESYLREDRARGFDPESAPLMRVALFRTADERHRMVWSFLQIVLDGWSMPLLFRDLRAFYTAFVRGRTPALGAAPPHREYVAWVERQDPTRAEPFWRGRLAGFDSPTPLPFEHVAAAPGKERREQAFLRLSEADTQALHASARAHGLTLGTLIHGAWAFLLSRFAGLDDVVFGATVSGRPAELPGVEEMVGVFINTVPMRVRLEGAARVDEWLRALQEDAATLREHQYTPLVEVQKWSDVPAGEALFESLVAFENYPMDAALRDGASDLDTLQIRVAFWREMGSYPLVLVAESGTRLHANLRYDARRVEPDSAERILAHLAVVLERMAAGPERRLSEVSLLRRAERAHLLHAWNGADTGYTGELCIHELIHLHVRRDPGAPALRFEAQSLSYGELFRASCQLAHRLRRAGVGPEVRVGICMERSPEMIVSVLGILLAGGAYLPIDPELPDERMAYMLGDGTPVLLLTQAALAPRLEGCGVPVLAVDAEADRLARESDEVPASGVGPDNLAYVIYTSGSTGRPKGVLVQHRGVGNTVLELGPIYGVGPGARSLAYAPLHFDSSVGDMFIALCNGAELVVAPGEAVLPGENLARLLREQRVNHFKTMPSALAVTPAEDLPELRTIGTGGEVLTADQVRRWSTGGRRVFAGYGATEASVRMTSTAYPPEDRDPPVGHPIPNTQLYVLDREMEPVPVGVAGDLYIGGVQVVRGYLGRPELTAEKFVPDPHRGVPGARLYRTGDVGRRRADGEVEFLGRRDHQVKVRGYRVELGEIEATLRTHEQVQEAAVVLWEDAPGRQRLVAYVSREPGAEVQVAELRELLAERLPPYMVPSAFVVLERMPVTVNGKVDRRALPAPERAGEAAHVAPRTPTEEVLAGIWAELLGMERVGVDESFFELGGDSILSIQVVSRARQRGLKLTPRQLFERPTVAGLAEVVEWADRDAAAPGAGPGPVTGEARLAPSQHRFFEHDFAERHHFNLGLLLVPREPLRAGLLARATGAVEAHHDALRLRFRREPDGSWKQWHAEAGRGAPLTVLDLSGVAEDARRAVIEAGAEQVQRSMELERGPLLRMAYFDPGADRPGRLLGVVHHLAADVVSWRILLEDLESAYTQLSRGEAVRLPAKTTSWKAWTERLAEHARSDALAREAAYWAEQARKRTAALPVDDPTAENTVSATRSVVVRLSEEETEALLREVPAAYRTQIDEVLLTALAGALARWTGQPRVRVELEGHGREEEEVGGADLSRTVGWFTSVYPVVLELPAAGGAGAALKATKEQLRSVPGRGIGYGLLRYLRGSEAGAELAGGAQAEVGFNYLGQLDQSVSAGAFFAFAQESAGAALDGRTARRYLLGVVGAVQGGRLEVEIEYAQGVHRRETVERLAEDFGGELRGLIAHCRAAEAGGYTPGDFPLAGLSQAELDGLLGSERGVEDVYPLSPMQEGMLFHALYAPESGVYVGQFGLVLEGTLDAGALERAWQGVVARHDALRASFAWEGVPHPVQVIRREVEVPFRWADWRGLDDAEQQAHLERYLEADRAAGFELRQAPLLRLAVFRLGDRAHQLVWTSHHLILDGWSLSLICRDVLELYASYAEGAAPQPAAGRRYRDYVAWLGRQDRSRAERFWRGALAGFGAPTPLPAARTRSGAEPGYGVETLRLSRERTESLLEQARRRGVTASTLVQGAWALLLSRYAGEDDVVFGTTVSGRPPELAGAEETVGLFINTLPVRARPRAEATLGEWVLEMQREQVEAREYEYAPLVQVQRWSEVPVGAALFESLVVFENYPVDQALGEAGGLKELRVRVNLGRQQTNFPLVLTAEAHTELKADLRYERSRTDGETAQRLAAHLEAVLEAMAAGLERHLSSVSLLRAGERAQLLAASRAVAVEHGRACVHELFARQAERTPDAAALVFEGETLTYAELERRANRLAHALRRRGVGPEARVAVCAERSAELVVALLAVLKAGGAYVPIDPAYPAERIAYLLDDSGCAAVLVQNHLRPLLGETSMEVIALEEALAESDDVDAPPQVEVDPENAAYVIYTSGSTGRPKGVVVTHGNVSRLFAATQPWFGFGAEDVWTLFHSYAFDFSVWEIWGALLHGGAWWWCRGRPAATRKRSTTCWCGSA